MLLTQIKSNSWPNYVNNIVRDFHQQERVNESTTTLSNPSPESECLYNSGIERSDEYFVPGVMAWF